MNGSELYRHLVHLICLLASHIAIGYISPVIEAEEVVMTESTNLWKGNASMSDSERIHIAADSAGKRTLCGRDVHPAMSVTHRPSKATCGLCKRVKR